MKNIINIVVGADHRGYAMKEYLKQTQLSTIYNLEWVDVGAYNDERSDYPFFAQEVAKLIVAGKASLGILLCGTGIGMAIAANRFKGIYAGLVWNEEVARLSKEDDNVNVLVLPSDFVSLNDAEKMVNVWLHASFKGEEYRERLCMIDC